MDEDELDVYLDAIDLMDPLLRAEVSDRDNVRLHEQLRDDDGHRVPGCYRVRPAPGQG